MKKIRYNFTANYLDTMVVDIATKRNLKGKYNDVNGEVKTLHWSELPKDDEFFKYMYNKVVKQEGGKK